MKKAQVSIEFVFVLASLMLLFILILITTNEKNVQNKQTSEFLAARNECFEIANAISMAHSNGEGFRVNISTYYNTSIYDSGLITVTFENKQDFTASCTFFGRLNNTVNINSSAVVKNVNGVVFIEE